MLASLTFEDFRPQDFATSREVFLRKTTLPSSLFDTLESTSKQAAFSVARVESMRTLMLLRKSIAGVLDGSKLPKDALLEMQALLAPGDFSLDAIHRLRTILNQNVAAAQAAARRMALSHDSVTSEFPFWMYMTVKTSTVRPAHAQFHARVYRWNDPIWNEIYPPWGFNCRCWVIPLRREDVEAMGIVVPDRAESVDLGEGALGGIRDAGSLLRTARGVLASLDEDLQRLFRQMERDADGERA